MGLVLDGGLWVVRVAWHGTAWHWQGRVGLVTRNAQSLEEGRRPWHWSFG